MKPDTFGAWLTRFFDDRTRRPLPPTRSALATALDVRAATVSAWCSGVVPGGEYIAPMFDALGLTAEERADALESMSMSARRADANA